jgi:hypothetical protein
LCQADDERIDIGRAHDYRQGIQTEAAEVTAREIRYNENGYEHQRKQERGLQLKRVCFLR